MDFLATTLVPSRQVSPAQQSKPSHLRHLAGHPGEPLLQQVRLADEPREPPRPQEPQPPPAAATSPTSSIGTSGTSAWVLGCCTTGAASGGSAILRRQSTL